VTCIIASRDGWMVADRRASFDSWIAPYQVRKIVRVDRCGMLVGVAGVGALMRMVENETRTCESFDDALDQLSGLLLSREGKQPSELLVLGRDRLVQVDPTGGLYELEAYQNNWSIGGGSMTAMGYLAGLSKGRDLRIITAEDAVDAIQFVGTLNVGVGDGVQVERL
jgi:20S proteasome alpha/beta subunit